MKKALLSALAGLVLLSACKKDDESVPTMQVSGTLSGSNEVPAVTASGSGSVTGTYTPSTKVLNYTITYTGLTGAPTGAHLHYGNPKHTTAAPTVPFSGIPTTTSGSFGGTVTLNAMQADSLMAGRIYANIHTSANSGGELRANLTVK
ncbi:MAG TPA: CHRD domain-containing protein [Hymenobacter sp.]|uniref:CHRD domain-containing protein n=1 Tax=Hymenobacter sp. TaxID=1898978 RepID=UPI002D7F5408|nr:CHRD domain-containing protein [Hymenobacter sp.]HET9504553.1 CHRD domain-containing protein [Hymenobacter sp.]